MPLPHPVKILLVDDQADNVVALEAALASVDCSLVTAQSGPDALRCALAQDFAVIVLDVHMPAMNGFETASLIRARDRSHSTPIIFLTADDRAGERVAEAYRLGAIDHLYKPFDLDILRSKVAFFVELFRKTVALEQQTAELTQVTADLVRHEHQVVVLNAELLQRTCQMEVASKQKSDFFTNMSHELRTPLNAIMGFSEIMLDYDATEVSDEQRKTFLGHIWRSGAHLLGLVNDILDLSKMEAGRMEVCLERVELHQVLGECVDIIRAVSDPKQLSLVTECEPADALITADPVRLKQILYNLLSNAVKFTPAGGQIRVSAQVDSNEAVITVRDSGIGIRPEDEELIFEPFRQAKAVPSAKHEGTGLGLPLARELVELHGGRIWFGSVPGGGSRFFFTLPQASKRGRTAQRRCPSLQPRFTASPDPGATGFTEPIEAAAEACGTREQALSSVASRKPRARSKH